MDSRTIRMDVGQALAPTSSVAGVRRCPATFRLLECSRMGGDAAYGGNPGCSADDAEKKGGSIVVVVAMVGGEMAQPALRPLCW